MTSRRSFFKLLGLSAGAVAVTGKVQAEAPVPLPPIPNVRSKRALVTTIAGHEWVTVAHGLHSPFVCAMAGDMKGKSVVATVEAIDLDQCRIQVPDPATNRFSWFKRKQPYQVFRVVVYVPA
jgi:hypothetical protein